MILLKTCSWLCCYFASLSVQIVESKTTMEVAGAASGANLGITASSRS